MSSMDLSHLVTIGLYAAKRGPFKEADNAYFQKHGLEQALADIVSQLAEQKPADPFKFIMDAAAKLSKGGSAAPAPAAEKKPAAAPKAAAKEEKPKSSAKATPKAAEAAPAGDEAAIKAVGDEIRALKEKLKGEGITGQKLNAHPDVTALVAKLAELKKGGGAAAPAPAAAKKAETAPAAAGPADEAAIKAVGDEIRALKEKLKGEGLSGKKVNDHPDVAALVKKLSDLKSGSGAAPAAAPAAKKDAKKEAPKKAAKETTVSKNPDKGGGVDIKKADNVPDWYDQVIKKAQLIEDYPVKGCFILRPWAYRIWELIQNWLDTEIKKLGVQNCYFPMFIPKCYIEKEEDHLNDFAPELAWVSRFGNEDMPADQHVAIRPTSETAMYAAYSSWVQSHRDLPIKLNQWCSVVRWEVKQTTPFLRTREFLWQEGHSAFAKKADAEKEVRDILELYALVYEHCLALPVVRGTKTKAETFPGADYTTTVEAYIPATGRAIQGATSHHLGQNFAKMFDISFQDPDDKTGKVKQFAQQNSWGITQRTLGVMTMVHGDDRGIVLPPHVACHQVVIVPVGITAKTSEDEKLLVNDTAMNYFMQLSQAGLRVFLDDREGYTSGNKFNHWEMKGVPLRLEVGPKDIEKGVFIMSKRTIEDKSGKVTGKHASMVKDVQDTLDEIHNEMYAKALADRDAAIVTISSWSEVTPNLNVGKLLMMPFCGDKECEEQIKEKTKEEAADEETIGGLKMGAKSLCVPLEEQYHKNCPPTCIRPGCGGAATQRTMFGRSY